MIDSERGKIELARREALDLYERCRYRSVQRIIDLLDEALAENIAEGTPPEPIVKTGFLKSVGMPDGIGRGECEVWLDGGGDEGTHVPYEDKQLSALLELVGRPVRVTAHPDGRKEIEAA